MNRTPEMITKGMLLAAGLGTRLRPLTDAVPKPMLRVGNRPLIDFALNTLARGGVKDVMINLHHLSEQIRTHVGDGNRYGLHISYSFEPTILGTGGGMKRCETFFGDAPFILMNADTLIAIDLSHVIAQFCAKGGDGLMVVRRLAPAETYKPVSISADGWLTGIGAGEHFYAGAQVCTKRLLDTLPEARPSCLIKDGLQPILAAGGRIGTFLHIGHWNDVGTPERYELAKRQDWLSNFVDSDRTPKVTDG
ncbi:MAG: nucleotidyltransferase family protein [Deltaproteobacteria bacterium]|nr:nucleotidyltransferase family protein [Deltaproteobacteria bacterium]